MIISTLLRAGFALLLSLAGTRLALRLLPRIGVMDTPNARSNHKAAVPRGGGLPMIVAALLLLPSAGMDGRIVVAAFALALLSFADDLRGLPALMRLIGQLAAVAFCLGALPGPIFPFLPFWMEWAADAFLWLWFLNLTNFMDGIDGISAMQAIAMCVGICFVRAIMPELPPSLATQACILAAAALGFYVFNRSPARLFMGDAGSIPLGFLIGYLLLSLAARGAWIAALILPAYYLADATSTLLARLSRGEKIWQAHSQHAYQKAVRAGLPHAEVVRRIGLLNATLVVLAMLSALPMMVGLAALAAAYALTACLLRQFTHAPKLS